MATKRQTWALFCATGLDCRGINLSVETASDLIDRSKAGEDITSELLDLGATGKPKKPKVDYGPIWEAAVNAGNEAAKALTPRPMTVFAHANPLNDASPVTESWYVSEGVCGFAWVKVKGNSGFGRWAKKNAGFRSSYPTGLQYWVSAFGQSYERKRAFAEAAVKVLRENGIEAYSGSRLD